MFWKFNFLVNFLKVQLNRGIKGKVGKICKLR